MTLLIFNFFKSKDKKVELSSLFEIKYIISLLNFGFSIVYPISVLSSNLLKSLLYLINNDFPELEYIA